MSTPTGAPVRGAPGAGPGASAGAPGTFDRRLIAPMVLGAILNPVNSSIIAVSLIPIGRALGAAPSATAWLVSGLYLATAIGQPVVGRLVDTYGPRRLFLAGSALVGVAGLLGALAPSLGVLVAARVLLGFGTCAGYPAAMHLIRSESQRTGHDSPQGVLTVLAVSTQTVAVIGPSLGGLLIGLGGWRTTFAVNVPLAATSLALGALRLPRASTAATGRTRAPARMEAPVEARGQRSRSDVVGMVSFAGMLVALLLFLMSPAPGHWYLLVLAAGGAAGLATWELRSRDPFLDLRMLAGNTPLLATYVRSFLATSVSYAFLYGFTQWLEDGRGLGASAAGLVLIPVFAIGIGVSAATGRRKGIRGKLLVGAATQVLVCVLLLTVHATSAIWFVVAIAAVMGIPQGLISLATQNAVYAQADPARMGSSAGLLRTFGYLGAIIASAADGLFFPHRADTAGMHHLALLMLTLAAVFAALTLSDRSLRHLTTSTAAPATQNPAAT